MVKSVVVFLGCDKAEMRMIVQKLFWQIKLRSLRCERFYILSFLLDMATKRKAAKKAAPKKAAPKKKAAKKSVKKKR